MMKKLVLSFMFAFCLIAVARAEDAPKEELPKGATSIEADDALEWNQNAQTYTARGNAVASQADTSIHADTLTAYYHNKDKNAPKAKSDQTSNMGGGTISNMVADGHVEITKTDSHATGDHATYDLNTKDAVLTGKSLKLTTPDYIVTARDNIRYNDGSGVATANGDAAMVTTKDNRRLSGDVLTANFETVDGQRSLKTLTAKGNVAVTTETEIVRGDSGIYYAGDEKAIIDGHVKITRGPNQLNGDRAEIDTKTGISRLLATQVDSKKPGARPRVRALLYSKGSPD